jgi:hypothetical protein
VTCPAADEVARTTGLDIRELVDTTDEGPGLGRCQYLADDQLIDIARAALAGTAD